MEENSNKEEKEKNISKEKPIVKINRNVKMEEKKTQNKLKCSKCGSGFVYVRIKDKEIVCRSCGHVEEKKEQKEK